MHDRRPQRVLASRARAAFADRFLEFDTIDLDIAADPDVVDRDSGVLAQQVIGVFGNRNIADHGAKHVLRGRVRLARSQSGETCLDVGRQELERANVEFFSGVFHLLGVDFHFTEILRSRTIFAHITVSSFIALPKSSGELPTGAMPWAKKRAFISVDSSAVLVSR